MPILTFDQYLSVPGPQHDILAKLFSRDAGLTIFDVGACEGEDSIKYSRLFPNADVYAFEPLPSNLARLEHHLKKYGGTNVHVVPTAIGSEDGEATFYVSSGRPEHAGDETWDYGNKSSSLLAPFKTKTIHTWLAFDAQITIPTTTLKQFIDSRNIRHVDFVHLDVQGAELMALKGAAERVRDITALWLEVEATALYENQPLRADIEDFMRRQDFECVLDTVDEIAGDQFYVNRRVVSAAAVTSLRGGALKRTWKQAKRWVGRVARGLAHPR
jgi:FkbM family methyltransferase